MTNPLALDKHAMRAKIAQAREKAFQAADRHNHVRAACERVCDVLSDHYGTMLKDVVLSGYMPMRSEIDPLPAMSAHIGPVCVPVIVGRGRPLEFHRWSPEVPMMEGAFKARIPQQRDPMHPHALIVPMLAFDTSGYRLGYGGGFYDRTLEALRADGSVFAIGFAFDVQQVARVPVEATDQRLDVIVTPSRALHF